MAQTRKRGAKDMVMTLTIVVLVVLLIGLYGGNMSFAPGATAHSGEVPTASVDSGFRHAEATMPFQVFVPEGVPDSWHPNSFSTSTPEADGAGTLYTVRGGWITSGGAFITVIQAGGDVNQVLTAEVGHVGATKGEITAGGAEWQITSGVRKEVAWVRSVGDTAILITGNASDDDFRTLAEAVAG